MTYQNSTIQRSATIIARAYGVDTDTMSAVLAAMQATSPRKATPIAPEAGFYAEPSIAQRTVKATAPKDWRKDKPSQSQIKRNRATMATINRFESVLGYRQSTFQSLNGGKACKFTAGAYSDFYKNVLKPMAQSLKVEAESTL